MFRELLNFIRWLWQAVVLPYVILALMTLFSEGVEAVGQLRHSLYVMLCFIRGRSHRRFPLRAAQLHAAKVHALQHMRQTTSNTPLVPDATPRVAMEGNNNNSEENTMLHATPPSLALPQGTSLHGKEQENETVSSSTTETTVSIGPNTSRPEATTSKSVASASHDSSSQTQPLSAEASTTMKSRSEPFYIQRRLLLGRRGETERWLSAVGGVLLVPLSYPLSYSHSLHQLVFNVIGPIQQPTVSTLPTRHTLPQWPPHYTRSYLTAHPMHTRATAAAAGRGGSRVHAAYQPFGSGQSGEMTTDEYSSTTTTTTTTTSARMGRVLPLPSSMMSTTTTPTSILHARHGGLRAGITTSTTNANSTTNTTSPDPYHMALFRNEHGTRRDEMSNAEDSARRLPSPVVLPTGHAMQQQQLNEEGEVYRSTPHSGPSLRRTGSGPGCETSDASAGVVYRRVSSRQLDFMRRGRGRHTTSSSHSGGGASVKRTMSSPIASITAHHVLSYQATRQKVLVMDLDETLCYVSTSTANMLHAPTFSEVIPTASGAELYHVWVRPYAQLFLTTMAKLFNLVLFTSSSKPYADTILSRVDPEYKLRRRYYRQDCRVVPRGTLAKLTVGTGPQQSVTSRPALGRTTRPVIHSSATTTTTSSAPAISATVVEGTRGDNPLSVTDAKETATNKEEEEAKSDASAAGEEVAEQTVQDDKPLLNENAKVFVKDLRILKVPPELVIMIDNCEECLLLNRENALIVAPYFPSAASPKYAAKSITDENGTVSEEDSQEEDDVLLALMPFLESMLVVPDVRSILRYGKAY